MWNWNLCDTIIPFLSLTLNRTNVELKQRMGQTTSKRQAPLIVPMWNWNIADQKVPDGFPITLNRTNVELKHVEWKARSNGVRKPLIVPMWNWNNKNPWAAKEGIRPLIVPMWNWNHITPYTPLCQPCPLIVPMWNWNPLTPAVVALNAVALNRTNVELKLSLGCSLCCC